jgi:S-adenosylmethionine synthetase
MAGHGKVVVMGEITTRAFVDYDEIVHGICGKDVEVLINIVQQSPFISKGVDSGGAGDQGIMVGYACDDNQAMIPREQYLARSLCQAIYAHSPHDGKTQITLDEDGEIIAIVASFQSAPWTEIVNIINEWLINEEDTTSEGIEVLANPAGDWSVGGIAADTGLTGRKLVVDNYGPRIPIGGGAFSGKDPTKVDRSAAYMARRVAVDLLKEHNAREVYVYLAYAIGHEKPVMATAVIDDMEFPVDELKYDLSPIGILFSLQLDQPRYEETAMWGHFGHGFPWDC